jgi:periplasmic divalent cation tolerance protein
MPAPDDLVLAYVTCADLAEAERIGTSLLEARLVACVNQIPGLRSRYWWQGRITESAEVLLLAKTTRARQDAVIAAVRAQHSYSTPCVVFVPLAGGDADFLAWVRAELQAEVTPARPAGTRGVPPPG